MRAAKISSDGRSCYGRHTKTQKEYLPPLFERFSDQTTLYDENEVIVSVAEEIKLMLNTRLSYQEIQKEDYQGHLPLLFFGLSDLSGGAFQEKNLAIPLIRKAINDFEPRVRSVEIPLFEWSKNHDALQITVSCEVLLGKKWKRAIFPIKLTQTAVERPDI